MQQQSPANMGVGKNLLLGIQHLFAMFGSTVLVPILTGLDPNVALFTAGLGTLIFHLCTKGKVPVFVGSSFAFIGVIQITACMYGGVDAGAANYTSLSAYQAAFPYVTGGIIVAGALYLVLALLVKLFGVERVTSFFPPVVTGPMIVVIGLTLAPTAFDNILASTTAVPDVLWMRWVIAISVVATMIIVSIFCKGFFKLVPIVFGIAVGYLVAAIMGQVDFSVFSTGSLGISAPNFFLPKFDLSAILIIAPTTLVTFMEHIGDITTNGAVVGKNFMKDPGLHRTLLGDGLATMAAGCLGGPANTTYSENTGVLAVTKNYNPTTLRIAAVFAMLMSFLGGFQTFLSSIPGPVMGGVSIILFGMISAVGMRTLVEAQLDFTHSRNLMIVAVMLVSGLGLSGGIQITESFTIRNIAICAILGVILNKVLPEKM